MKIIKNYIGCEDKKINKHDLDKFHKLINKIGNHLAGLEEKQRKKKDNIIDESDNEFKLSDELFRIGNKLNKWILCESCKGKEIEKLTDKCGNEEIARFLYQHKLNAKGDCYIYSMDSIQ